jgi:hypothetical protein
MQTGNQGISGRAKQAGRQEGSHAGRAEESVKQGGKADQEGNHTRQRIHAVKQGRAGMKAFRAEEAGS